MPATCCGVPLSPAPPTASRATGRPPRSTSGTSRTRAARTSGRRCGGARPRVGETKSGATQWKRRQDARAERNRDPEGARGSALSARPGTRGCRHLSRSAAGGPRALVPGRAAPGPPWPTHHAHKARHHLRLRHEAPQVEGAASVGRAIGPALHVAVAAEPRMAGNQPDCPAPSRPAHGGGAGRRQGGANRREVGAVYPSVLVVEAGRSLELRLRRQGAEGGGKAHPWESVLLSSTRKDQRVPRKRHPRRPPLYTYTVPW